MLRSPAKPSIRSDRSAGAVAPSRVRFQSPSRNCFVLDMAAVQGVRWGLLENPPRILSRGRRHASESISVPRFPPSLPLSLSLSLSLSLPLSRARARARLGSCITLGLSALLLPLHPFLSHRKNVQLCKSARESLTGDARFVEAIPELISGVYEELMRINARWCIARIRLEKRRNCISLAVINKQKRLPEARS